MTQVDDMSDTMDRISEAARDAVKGKKMSWMVIVTAPTSDTDDTAVVVAGGTIGRDTLPELFGAIARANKTRAS